MRYHELDRSRKLIAGMWLIGIGLLLASRHVWPEILLVVGSIKLSESLFITGRERSRRAGVLLIVLGLFLSFRLGVVEILLLLGAWMIVDSLRHRSPYRKPVVDVSLD
ncbi:hypothetical protein [Paludisphaera rhizosphaerae]|uniref:hypothetical protein n=1 Tax=Paludisphaera rhizosphaerae TaxID=2711216 RepID=UPI0013E9B429|nr:hypothetical protein [Paludisphaera rhizosphaerae]